MRKKFLLLFVFLISGISPVLSQKTFLTSGLSLFAGWDNNGKNATLLPAFTIFPGIHILQTKGFAIDAGAPVSIGLSCKEDHFDLGADIPVTLNLNFGYGSTKNSNATLGFFIGGGVGYHYSYNEIYDYYGTTIEKDHLSIIGILLQTGIALRSKKNEDVGGWFRFSWLSPYPHHRQNVIGLGVIAILENKNKQKAKRH